MYITLCVCIIMSCKRMKSFTTFFFVPSFFLFEFRRYKVQGRKINKSKLLLLYGNKEYLYSYSAINHVLLYSSIIIILYLVQVFLKIFGQIQNKNANYMPNTLYTNLTTCKLAFGFPVCAYILAL